MGRYQLPYDFRDVSRGLAKLRDFLLGRKNVNPHRFPPLLAPRSIPPPDVPRGPDDKYSDQYYFERHALNSVKPPVVAPVATAATSGRCFPGGQMKFPSELPTPGCVWWFDAHCYYKEVFQTPCGDTPNVPGPLKATAPCPCPEPKSPQPQPPRKETVAKSEEVQKEICQGFKKPHVTPKLSSGVCDPCCKEDEKKK